MARPAPPRKQQGHPPRPPLESPLAPPGGLRPVSGGLRDQELPRLCQARSCQGVSLTRHVKMRRGLYSKPRKVSKDPAGELASVSKAQAQAPPCRPPGDSAPWARPQGPGLGLCSDTCPRSSPPPPLPVQGTELPSEQGQSTPAPASQLPAGTGGTWAKGHAGKVCALRRGRGREPLRRRGSRGVRGPRGLGLPRRWHPPRPRLPITDLTHGGKANQRHPGVAGLHDVEALAFGGGRLGGLQQLGPILGQLRLQQAQVVLGG